MITRDLAIALPSAGSTDTHLLFTLGALRAAQTDALLFARIRVDAALAYRAHGEGALGWRDGSAAWSTGARGGCDRRMGEWVPVVRGRRSRRGFERHGASETGK